MDFKKYGVLYIDDEEKNLQTFQITYKKYYTVYIADSVKEAFKILMNNPMHVVITDQQMPEMTGTDFLQRIHYNYPDLVRMILTAHADQDVIIKALNEYNVFGFILKPWDNIDLKVKIDQALEKYEKDARYRIKIKELEDEIETLKEELAKKNLV